MAKSRYYLSIFAVFAALTLSGCGGSDEVEEIEDTIEAGLQAMIDRGLMPQLDTTETLGGVDADADGLRDDIKSWIDTLAINNDQKQVTIGNAKAMQTLMLVDLNDAQAVNNVDNDLVMSVVCMADEFGASAEGITLMRDVESYTGNTQLRYEKYAAYNNMMNGSVTTLPTCP